MRDDHQKLLRAMLEAKRALDAATAAQNRAWEDYLAAQASFTGKFAQSDHPLGPFVVGDVLVEDRWDGDQWPPTRKVFDYRPVVRCYTGD